MTKHRAGRIELLAIATTLVAATASVDAARADILPAGGEFQVNTYTTSFQYTEFARSVSSGADGRFVVVWTSIGQDGSDTSVHGQCYDAAGAPTGTEFQVNSYTTAAQGDPAVSSAADGSFVVVWTSIDQDGSLFSVHGQRYDATGAVDGSEFQINTYTTDAQREPAVSSAADGSFVVVWDSYGQDGSDTSVHGQRYDATGAAAGTEFQVNSYTTSFQGGVIASSAGDGSFVVVWESYGQDGSDWSVHGQRYDATGAADGTEFQVNTYTTGYQYRPAVSADADGSFVVVWDSYGQDGSDDGVFGQRYDAAGAPDGTEFQISSYTTNAQNRAAVSFAPDSSFVVVWESNGQDGSYDGVFGQRYDAAGAPDGTEFQVNSYTTYTQFRPAVAPGTNGNFVVAWTSIGQDGSYDGVFGRLLCTDADADGSCDTRCALVPVAGCNDAAQAKLDVNEKKAGKEKMKLQWKKLADATAQGDFGDPVGGTTEVVLCIYDDADALVQEYIVDRAGEQCAGKDCWKAKSTKGYGYKDKENASDGVSKIGYGSGDAGKGKADAGGKNNAAKSQTSLPTGVVAKLTSNTAPTIQMVTSDDFCATATMNQVKKDEATRYSAQLK